MGRSLLVPFILSYFFLANPAHIQMYSLRLDHPSVPQKVVLPIHPHPWINKRQQPPAPTLLPALCWVRERWEMGGRSEVFASLLLSSNSKIMYYL